MRSKLLVAIVLLGAAARPASVAYASAREVRDLRRATSLAQVSGDNDARLARGRAAFDHVCGRCHPHGNADVGRRLIGLGWSEDRVRTQVRRGRGTMRAISPSRMSDQALDDVMVYLRSIGTVR